VHLKQLLLTNDYERDKITQDALREVRNMKNPFQYGGVVSSDAFCNRKKEEGSGVRSTLFTGIINKKVGRSFVMSN